MTTTFRDNKKKLFVWIANIVTNGFNIRIGNIRMETSMNYLPKRLLHVKTTNKLKLLAITTLVCASLHNIRKKNKPQIIYIKNFLHTLSRGACLWLERSDVFSVKMVYGLHLKFFDAIYTNHSVWECIRPIHIQRFVLVYLYRFSRYIHNKTLHFCLLVLIYTST